MSNESTGYMAPEALIAMYQDVPVISSGGSDSEPNLTRHNAMRNAMRRQDSDCLTFSSGQSSNIERHAPEDDKPTDDDAPEPCPCTPEQERLARFDAVRFHNATCENIEMVMPIDDVFNMPTPFLFKVLPKEGEPETNTHICVVRRLSDTFATKGKEVTPGTPKEQIAAPPQNPPRLKKRPANMNRWNSTDVYEDDEDWETFSKRMEKARADKSE